MFRSILVPLDFSVPSLVALRAAVGLARHGAARLTLLHVGALHQGVLETYGVPVPDTLLRFNDEVAQAAEAQLLKIAKEEVPDDVTWTAKIRTGTPNAELLAELRTGDYDLVVVGTHGRTGLAHAVLGSVTEHLVRHANVPVLVAR